MIWHGWGKVSSEMRAVMVIWRSSRHALAKSGEFGLVVRMHHWFEEASLVDGIDYAGGSP